MDSLRDQGSESERTRLPLVWSIYDRRESKEVAIQPPGVCGESSPPKARAFVHWLRSAAPRR